MSDWKPVQYRAGELVTFVVILTVVTRLIKWADLSPRSALYVSILVPYGYLLIHYVFGVLQERDEDRRAKEDHR